MGKVRQRKTLTVRLIKRCKAYEGRWGVWSITAPVLTLTGVPAFTLVSPSHHRSQSDPFKYFWKIPSQVLSLNCSESSEGAISEQNPKSLHWLQGSPTEPTWSCSLLTHWSHFLILSILLTPSSHTGISVLLWRWSNVLPQDLCTWGLCA